MKNLYCLNPGEFFAGQEILQCRKDIELYFPLKDKGVDLMAIKKGSATPVRIQVKESRTYGEKEHSWHQVRQTKLGDADVFVFVSYVPRIRGQKNVFNREFIVIPQADLRRLCEKKKPSQGAFSFYFLKDGAKLIEIRDSYLDVSKYLAAWHLI